MIPSPKERFLADATLTKHHANTVASSQFIAAFDAAMGEYSMQCSAAKNPTEAGLLLRGAHEFARIFCELANPRTRTVTVDRDNLT